MLYQVALYILLVPFLTLEYCMKILAYLVNGYNLLKSGGQYFPCLYFTFLTADLTNITTSYQSLSCLLGYVDYILLFIVF